MKNAEPHLPLPASRAQKAFWLRYVTKVGLLPFGSGREVRCPKGQRGRMGLNEEVAARPEIAERLRRVCLSNAAHLATAIPQPSPSSSSATSLQARREALSCDCGSGTTADFPLPFTVTIPVSFEHLRRWCASLGASTGRRAKHAGHHRTPAGTRRKLLIHHQLSGPVM